jgi:small-conductance mechanosensitive channel
LQELAVEVLGVDLVGLEPGTVHRLLLSVAALVVLGAANSVVRRTLAQLPDHGAAARARFWGQQASSLLATAIAILVLVSLWVQDTRGIGSIFGLITAGLAVASQKAVTSFAAYFVILRGKTFTVGDVIVVGQVRGKVNSVGFFQTVVLEIGESPPEQASGPAVWVRGRQFTGRIVTVSNSVIFDSAIYNYTHDFPFVWEEMMLPVAYRDDRQRAEQILLDAVRHHAVRPDQVHAETARHVERRYGLQPQQFEPRVYWRATDNWVELTARFVCRAHEARLVRDAITRELLAGLDAAGIGVASSTSEIVGLPTVRVEGHLS